ncbi:type 1 glutamine amidotransferase domain-containing protein [Tomitella fengzijianii]|uniref:Type 1 glutamine amidotransferase n=1 Tax=Tomitella fengzijianii TaxID=2597660 RepID=A0A516X2T5_9ACTN|nr:type 1 glutamine amidotransferase domain-containing protein [Tomitella fengzijianii]QDQ97350.1 type 1 glutamine amidotransferase [Tomitella fengzijianii]
MSEADAATGLGGRNIAMLVAPEGVEQIELTEPWRTVQRSGGTPTLVSTRTGSIQAFNHLDREGTFEAEAAANADAASDYDALVLPGGVANPDILRTDADAVAFVRAFFDAGKPVAVICHGPWTLIEADAVRGRVMTSWPSLRTDLRNAGAEWVDQEVVVCDHGPNILVSSRMPDDLPAFCSAMVRAFSAPRTD